MRGVSAQASACGSGKLTVLGDGVENGAVDRRDYMSRSVMPVAEGWAISEELQGAIFEDVVHEDGVVAAARVDVVNDVTEHHRRTHLNSQMRYESMLPLQAEIDTVTAIPLPIREEG